MDLSSTTNHHSAVYANGTGKAFVDHIIISFSQYLHSQEPDIHNIYTSQEPDIAK